MPQSGVPAPTLPSFPLHSAGARVQDHILGRRIHDHVVRCREHLGVKGSPRGTAEVPQAARREGEDRRDERPGVLALGATVPANLD
jgi:hypothetical protein